MFTSTDELIQAKTLSYSQHRKLIAKTFRTYQQLCLSVSQLDQFD